MASMVVILLPAAALTGVMQERAGLPSRWMVQAPQRPAPHPRRFERGQACYDWRHYLSLVERKPGALRNGAPFAGMPESLMRLQRLLLKRDGGDRVMSQMLAVVPKAGLEAVLVAVELVLESGVVSVEHVLNVIGRFKQEALPEAVRTHLAVKEAPIADTGRYDRLRRTEIDHA